MKFLIYLTIIIHLNTNSAIRYKNRKYVDSRADNDKYNAADKVEGEHNSNISQRSNLDPEYTDREKQIEYELAYQKFKEQTAHKKGDTKSETKRHEYSPAEHYDELEKFDLETRKGNGLEPKGFWSRENGENIMKSTEIEMKFNNGTTKTVILDKDHTYIDKLDLKYLKDLDSDLKNFQKRFKIKQKDFLNFKKKKMAGSKESVEKSIDKDYKNPFDTRAQFDEKKIKKNYSTTFTDRKKYNKNMKQEILKNTDKKHYRRRYLSEEDDSKRREESFERKRDSRESYNFETKTSHRPKSKRQKTRHIAKAREITHDAIHRRKNRYYHNDRDYRRKTTHTRRVEKDKDEVIEDTKKQKGNPEEIEDTTIQEDGKTKDRHHYPNQYPKEISIEYTDARYHDIRREKNDKHVPEEENKPTYEAKSRDVNKFNKIKSNQLDTKHRSYSIEDSSQSDHDKEYSKSEKYSDHVKRRLENADRLTPKYKRLSSHAIPRRIKSFSMERFEKANNPTQDQHFEQEINDYHNPDVLPPQVPHRKLKPIHISLKKMSGRNEPLNPMINPGEDAVEMKEVSKPGKSEEVGEYFKKSVAPIETATLRKLYTSDSEHLDKHPNKELTNVEKIFKNHKFVEHVTKSRYEQYLQHFHDNNDASNQDQLQNNNYASNTKSDVNENAFKNYEKNNNNKHYYRNNNFRNKKEYETKNKNEDYNQNGKYDKNINKNDKVKKYVDGNNKFDNRQDYNNNENNRNTEKINNDVNKNELANIKHIKSNDYYDKDINNAPNYDHENKNYIINDGNNQHTYLKNNYYDKNSLNDNNYKNNNDNANNNNYEDKRNSKLRLGYSNDRDEPDKYNERRPIQEYEFRPTYNQPEDKYKLITLSYQNEMDTPSVKKDYDKQPAIDTNYGEYPENYQTATPSINNEILQRPFLGSLEGVLQKSYLVPAKSSPTENLKSEPNVRVEEKPMYRIHYLDFRRRNHNKHNLSGTKNQLDTRKNSDSIINDDSNHTKSKISKDLIREWRKGYGNVENEQKPAEFKTKRRTSKKTDLNVIGPREIAYLKEKYTLPRTEQNDSPVLVSTMETSEQDKPAADFSVENDNDAATQSDAKPDISEHLTPRKNKHETKKHKKKKQYKPSFAEKDDMLNLTDTIIENKENIQKQLKVSIETTMSDDLEEMEETEEKNYTKSFKGNVWNALEKSVLDSYNEHKTDSILLSNIDATAYDSKTELNMSHIKTQLHNQNNDLNSEINGIDHKPAIRTRITEKPPTRWVDRYKNLNIQMLQYSHDHKDPSVEKLKFSHEIRKHKKHIDERLSDHRDEDNSKNYHNNSISKNLGIESDDENLKSEHRHKKYHDHLNKQKHFRHKNKHEDEEVDTEVDSNNNINEKKHKYYKSDDHNIVDDYITNKDRVDLTEERINHVNSKSKPHQKYTHRNDDSDQKIESSDQTYDKSSNNQKVHNNKRVQNEVLDKSHAKHDDIMEKLTDQHVKSAANKRDHKSTITHSKSEFVNNKRSTNDHINSSYTNKIQNDDSYNNTENSEKENEHIVSTYVSKQSKTDKKIVKHQINLSNKQSEENKKDISKVRDINIFTRNKSETIALKTINETRFHESYEIRARSDHNDGDETISPFDYEDLSDSKFPFIVMLVHELDKQFKSVCTAVTITPNFAITAAHCIPTNPKSILHIKYENHTKIHESKHFRNKTENNDIRDSTKVLKIYEHPNYRQVYIKRDPAAEYIHSSTVNDIAVLKTQYNLPEPVGKLSAFEFNSLLGVSVNFYGMKNNNCTKGTLADVTLRQGDKKYILRTYTGAVTTCSVKDKGIRLCLAPECSHPLGEKLNMLEGGPVIFSDRVVGIVNEVEPAITFIPVSPYLDWISQILHQEKPVKPLVKNC